MNVGGATAQPSSTRSSSVIDAVGVPGAIGVLVDEVAPETPGTSSSLKKLQRSTESEELKKFQASFSAIRQTAGMNEIIEELENN